MLMVRIEEIEQVVAPPPPTEPELDDPIVFDPKVSGIWDHLLAQMTDEQKIGLKEQAKKEQASPSYRHTTPASSRKQEKTAGDSGPVESAASSSVTTQESRGPSRSHPLHLGLVISLLHAGPSHFLILTRSNSVFFHVVQKRQPPSLQAPQWVLRLSSCTTHEDVMTVFRLVHDFCWSEKV